MHIAAPTPLLKVEVLLRWIIDAGWWYTNISDWPFNTGGGEVGV